MLVFVTGGSKNMVLVKLRNKGDFDKLDDDQREKLCENNDDESQILIDTYMDDDKTE